MKIKDLPHSVIVKLEKKKHLNFRAITESKSLGLKATLEANLKCC